MYRFHFPCVGRTRCSFVAVVPAAIEGGAEYIAAVVTAALLTVLTRRPLLAMVSGVAVAGIVRALLSLCAPA